MEKNSILDEILLEKPNVKSLKEEDIKLALLMEEINEICDDGIRSFVRSILFRASNFWLMPGGFIEGEHPEDEMVPGGNVVRTKRAFKIAKMMCESYSMPAEEVDTVLAAVLLHGITKAIPIEGEEGKWKYDPMYPYTVDAFVHACQQEDKKSASESQSSTLYASEDVIQVILRLVRCHLGPWSPIPETIPVTYLDMIVHISANIASKIHKII